MNMRQRAALVIRSLMRDLRVSNHIVNSKDEGYISAAALVEQLEGPSVGNGTPDAALAIAEHAYRAGWSAALEFADPAAMWVDESARQRAWSEYDPPEHIKALS